MNFESTFFNYESDPLFAPYSYFELEQPEEPFFESSRSPKSREEQQPAELDYLDFFYSVEEDEAKLRQQSDVISFNEEKLVDDDFETPLSPSLPTQDDSSALCSSNGCEMSPVRDFAEDLSNVNLNDFVDDMLGARPSVLGIGNSFRMPSGRSRSRRPRRARKTNTQMLVLETEFARNPVWSRSFMRKLGAQLDLSEAQIYKWNWDQRKKFMSEEQRVAEMFGSRSAFDSLSFHF